MGSRSLERRLHAYDCCQSGSAEEIAPGHCVWHRTATRSRGTQIQPNNGGVSSLEEVQVYKHTDFRDHSETRDKRSVGQESGMKTSSCRMSSMKKFSSDFRDGSSNMMIGYGGNWHEFFVLGWEEWGL